jgi:FkbH-like protein
LIKKVKAEGMPMQQPDTGISDRHNDYRFRCPQDLVRRQAKIRRILLVGQCTADHIRLFFAEMHQIECDFVHIATMGDPNIAPPRPLADYDLQIVILPQDVIMPVHTYCTVNYSDKDAERLRYETSIAEMERLLDWGLRWHRQSGLLTFVANLLVPQQNPVGRFRPRYDLRNPRYYVEKINESLTLYVEGQKNIFMLDLDGIVSTFGKKYIQDDSIWSDSHGAFITNDEYHWFEKLRSGPQKRLEALGPITDYYTIGTDDCYRSVCEEIISMYRSLRQVDMVKLVVIDLDDTAWRGISSEESLSHDFLILGWPTGFIESLAYLKRRGILLAIISKNDLGNATKAWNFAYGKIFPLSNFVSVKINWKPKAENMEEILTETNVLPKSTLFIDDNPAERDAIQSAFPDLRVIGSNPYYLRRILLWSAELEQPLITEESMRRTEMVKSQIERETVRRQISHEEFITSLDLATTINVVRDAGDPRINRMLELLNKTNQFNTTGRTWTLEEFSQNLSEGMEGYTVDVTDKFTKYGLVCVALVRGNSIEQFVMSCRVVGLEVETTTLAAIEAAVASAGFDHILGAAIDTGANLLSRDLYKKAGFSAAAEGWTKNLGGTIRPDTALAHSKEPTADGG